LSLWLIGTVRAQPKTVISRAWVQSPDPMWFTVGWVQSPDPAE